MEEIKEKIENIIKTEKRMRAKKKWLINLIDLCINHLFGNKY
jgi:hypothetical protein